MTAVVRHRWKPTDVGFPGPSPRDMLRDFTSIRSDPLAFLVETQRRHGDVVAFPVPGPPALLLSDPRDVRQVLQLGASRWGKDTVQYRALSRVTGTGLLASDDPSWLRHRRAAAPAFHHQRLAAVATHVRVAARAGSAGWRDLRPGGQVVDVAPPLLAMALDVVGRALFSADLSSRSLRLIEATSDAARLIVSVGRSVLPLPPWVPSRTNRRLHAAARELDGLSRALIAQRRRTSGSAHGDDLLGLLIDADLGDDEIRDELVTMVVAGHETVAAALAWTLMLLAEDPPAQDRMRAEVSALGRDVPMVRSSAVVPWTRAVIDESLRLFPPAWVMSRRSTAPDRLGGRDVPAGTLAIISPWVVHRRPGSWADPLRFRPQRFLDGEGTVARADYLPFGLGPRLCIGRDFALGEMAVVLGELVRGFSFRTPSGWTRPRPEALSAAHPAGGMHLEVVPQGDGTPPPSPPC
ncbi:MAG TPA: cytochrome P450 [Actinomycetales bacterium]|nr:cytochrome P450 [Actinomycetales bacterium]